MKISEEGIAISQRFFKAIAILKEQKRLEDYRLSQESTI